MHIIEIYVLLAVFAWYRIYAVDNYICCLNYSVYKSNVLTCSFKLIQLAINIALLMFRINQSKLF